MNSLATQRVIALVDMDCFYCQVETRLNPSLKGKPLAVVQYNQWKGGGIIAVNYEARALGVTRHMRGDEAKEKCPEIILAPVPTIRGKADLSNYRDAGDEVASVFSEFSDCVQRASIDEAYLDLTKAVQNYITDEKRELTPDDLPYTYVVGHCDLNNKNEDVRKKGLVEWLNNVKNEETTDSPNYQLAVGAKIVEKMRREIFNRTGFHCSAGIAHNKILAKLTAGLHKPKKQTILPQDSVPELYDTLPIHKVRNLGGKLGQQVSDKLSITYMSELYKFSLGELKQKFDDKTGQWLYNIARGIDLEPVTSRLRPESIGCCKNFTGKNMLTTRTEVEHWMRELATEVSERLMKDLERNKRRARQMLVSFSQETAMSRCGPLNSYETKRIVSDAMELLKKCNTAPPNEDLWSPPIKYLGLSVSKFSEEVASIQKFLTKKPTGNSQTPSTSTAQIEDGNVDNSEVSPTPETSTGKPSFFLNFLNKKKESDEVKQKLEKTAQQPEKISQEDEEDGKMWISLSEVFPDINEAESDVVEILPDALRKKFRERLESLEGKHNDEKMEERVETMTETCGECGKVIPLIEFPEHSDYHAALKLNSEINGPVIKTVNKSKGKEPETQGKRKKKGAVTPAKKMKSITAFFNVVPKQ